jgi:hypothetical protein
MVLAERRDLVTGMSTLCGFAIFAQMLLVHLGIHLPILGLFALGVIASYGVAYKDIQLAAKMMLIFEGISNSKISGCNMISIR